MEKLIYKCLKPFKFNFQGLEFDLKIDVDTCYENGNKKIVIKKKKENIGSFIFATISQYVPGTYLEEDEFILYQWEIYEDLIQYLLKKTDFFENTYKIVETEFGDSPVLKLR